MIAVIPDDIIEFQEGYYHGVYVMLHLKKEYGVNRKEEQVDTNPYSYEKVMEDARLDGEIERHRRMIFQCRNIWVDDN